MKNTYKVLAGVGIAVLGFTVVSNANQNKSFDPVYAAQQSYDFTLKEKKRADIETQKSWHKHQENEKWLKQANEHNQISLCNLAHTKTMNDMCLSDDAVYEMCGIQKPVNCIPENKPVFNSEPPAVKMLTPTNRAGNGSSIVKLVGLFTTQ